MMMEDPIEVSFSLKGEECYGSSLILGCPIP